MICDICKKKIEVNEWYWIDDQTVACKECYEDEGPDIEEETL